MRHATLLEPSLRGCRMIKKSVLVVEDEEDIRELVSYHLLKEGYQVAGVASGEEALATAEERPPDLILLDLMLPGVDGLTVCQRLRKNPRTESVPIVILTAKGEESDIVGGLNLGANDYVTKPFSPKVLLARVRAALRRSPAAAAGANRGGGRRGRGRHPDPRIADPHGAARSPRRRQARQPQLHRVSRPPFSRQQAGMGL